LALPKRKVSNSFTKKKFFFVKKKKINTWGFSKILKIHTRFFFFYKKTRLGMDYICKNKRYRKLLSYKTKNIIESKKLFTKSKIILLKETSIPIKHKEYKSKNKVIVRKLQDRLKKPWVVFLKKQQKSIMKRLQPIFKQKKHTISNNLKKKSGLRRSRFPFYIEKKKKNLDYKNLSPVSGLIHKSNFFRKR